MMLKLLSDKLQDYSPNSPLEQENVLQELMQYIILSSLAQSRFFEHAAFHGGTCLRLIHQLPRFSEDLDFVLKEPHPQFEWLPFLESVKTDLEQEGLLFEVKDKSKLSVAVQKAFLKVDSVGVLLEMELPYYVRPKKFKIKLEIDTRPPEHSQFETSYLSFPRMSAITTQDLPSGFASKSHALLCRPYVKGRDWYDLLWYLSQKTPLNFKLLYSGLEQQNYDLESFEDTYVWYVNELKRKVLSLDWQVAKQDVARFLPRHEQDSLQLWNSDFFVYHLDRYLRSSESITP